MRRGNWKYILRNPDKNNPAFVNSIGNHFMRKIVAGDIHGGDGLYDLSADKLEQNNLLGKGLAVESEMKNDTLTLRININGVDKV